MKKLVEFISMLILPLTVAVDLSVIEEVSRTLVYVLGAITAFITLVYNIVVWIKKAKKDGKIDDHEIAELGEIIKQDQDKKEDLKNEKTTRSR